MQLIPFKNTENWINQILFDIYIWVQTLLYVVCKWLVSFPLQEVNSY